MALEDPGPEGAAQRLSALLSSLELSAPQVDSVEQELEWLGRLYPMQTALAYVPHILSPTIRNLFLNLVSTTHWHAQTTPEFQSQVVGQLWQDQSPDLPAVAQCIVRVLHGTPQLSRELLPMILHETSRNSSHLACLTLTRIAPLQAAEAIAEAVLSTNDLFFIRELVSLPVLHYTQNVSSALIAGAMTHPDVNSTAAQCIGRFPPQDAQFAQVAMHLLQTKRSMSSCRAAVEYLCPIPQFQLKLVSFLVNNPGLWLDLDCHEHLARTVSSSNECADLLGLFLLETAGSSHAQMMAIGAMCHSKWFSPQEGERFAACLVDALSACLSREEGTRQHQAVVMWALQQALRQQPELFFNSGNSFARLATLILSLLREESNDDDDDEGVLSVLELLLEQELLVSKDNRFSFCFSQLAELLQRMLERTEETGGGHHICRVLCLLVSVCGGEVEGFVSWILSKQVQRLERKLASWGRKRRQQEQLEACQGACSLQQLASLRVVLACLQRLNNSQAFVQDCDALAQCVGVAMQVWREEDDDGGEEEERKLLAMAVLRMACLGNTHHFHHALLEVVQTELLSRLASPKRMESGLALCFTQSHHAHVFAHVTLLLGESPAARRACGEMLVHRLVVTELEAWLCVHGVDSEQALDVLLVFAKHAHRDHYAHVAWLASKYLGHLVFHLDATATTASVGVKCLDLICAAAPHSPPAFASKYFEWKVLFDGGVGSADVALAAMEWVT